MKSPILVVGNIAEDYKGYKVISDWSIGSGGEESYSFDELKAIAIENGTYFQVDDIPPSELKGTRWYGQNEPTN
jgi:hypothetical protein